jgi:Phage tail lysozyme
LTGQAISESGLNPRAVHDGGRGYGIYGAGGPRRASMFKWLDANGYPRDSLEGQARYMAHEAMTYKQTSQALRSATPESLPGVNRVLTDEFEAPKIRNYGRRWTDTQTAIQARQPATPAPPNTAPAVPGAAAPGPQTQVGPGTKGGVLIAFAGLNGALDRDALDRIAKAKGMTAKVFQWTEEDAAREYMKQHSGERVEVLGFSKGAETMRNFLSNNAKTGLPQPSAATAVGQYSPQGQYPLIDSSGVPIEHYLDKSGRGLAGQAGPNVHYLGTDHSQTMAGVAGDVEKRTGNASPLPPTTAASSTYTGDTEAVRAARAYLVETAQGGATASAQGGMAEAVARLHPEFALRLAAGVKELRDAGYSNAGINSAFRTGWGPTATGSKFDVGGYSLHSIGAATDLGGIGSAGSGAASRAHQILAGVGIYGPYGPNNAAEWNHFQLVPQKTTDDPATVRAYAGGKLPTSDQLLQLWKMTGVPFPAERVPAPDIAMTPSGLPAQLDRTLFDRQMGQEFKSSVNTKTKLVVDVEAPRGANVSAEGKGAFKNVETNRSFEATGAI